MAALILPHKWRQQPQARASVDPASPFSAGLDFAWLASADLVNAKSGAQALQTNSAGSMPPQATPHGVGRYASNGNVVIPRFAGHFPGGNNHAWTIAAVHQAGGHAADLRLAGFGYPFADNGVFLCLTGSDVGVVRAGVALQPAFSVGQLVAGETYFLVASYDPGTGQIIGVSRNLRTMQTTDGLAGAGAWAAPSGEVNWQVRGQYIYTSNIAPGATLMATGHLRSMSLLEMRRWSENPWQIFAPVSRRLFVDVVAGGPGAALEAAGVAQASSGASLSTGILLAAASAAVAASTASLTTGVRLSASATAQAASSANLSTGIKLAAVAASTATSTAALTTQPAGLSANAQASASTTAALTTGVMLAASATAQASSTAALTTQSAGLAASAVAQASSSAALTTGVALSANAQASATSTAALTTQAAGLAAAAIAQASSSAALTTAIRLSATAAASASSAASLTTSSSAWAAAAVAQASSSAQLTTAIALQAVAVARASSSAALKVGPALVVRRWSSIRGEPKLAASDLGSRVTLQKRTTGVDAAGQGFDTWEAWATVWANVRRVSARDYDSAGQPQASGLVSIVIRYRDGIEPGMRVLCDGQAWDIVGDPVAMSAGLLRFEAASGVRDAV